MEKLLICLSAIALTSTIIPLIRYEHWIIRIFDFPYVQFTIFNLVILLIVATGYFDNIVLGKIFLPLISISLVFRIWIIFPYTPWASKKVPNALQDDNQSTLKIISANVLMYNDDYSGLVEQVKLEKPDLVLLVEPDKKWEVALRKDFEELFPYSLKKPLDNTYGLLFYSTYPLSDAGFHHLVEKDVPSIDAVITLNNGMKVRFFGLHPKPPSPTENKTSLPRDVELILTGKKAKESQLPVIIAGDLNDVAWSHTSRLFLRISELLDPRMGRGFFNTYHTRYFGFRWPLDHLFLSSHFSVVNIKRLDNFHSDHFPISAQIALAHNLKHDQATEVDESDKQEICRKLDKISTINN